MTRLTELINAIKVERLSREQLEQYYAELTSLYATTALAMSDLEKDEAKYLDKNLMVENKAMSEATRRRQWRATKEGLDLIQAKNEVKVIEKLLQSVKHRIFNVL